ncbi:dual specificity protein phosphatase CDC14AB-like [Paramacrobiotus metropolitanus]|uniref:dual specificity protein phosphatase CDC14AB-like n=1 Tax=Paramacrobiotus metropolitanus TaxID=2943436 RepID=UPI00244623F6|nr:dual specificity protein phosphatase CDC14AB-like [Paramacrobiotus metropolitanus]
MTAAAEAETAPGGASSLEQSGDDIVKDAIEIIPDRFYFGRLASSPHPHNNYSFFNTDFEFVYDSFFDDFGPLNIAKVYRYCEKVWKRLHPNSNVSAGAAGDNHGTQKLFHYSSTTDERKFINAAWLVGAFCILKLHKSPDEVMNLLDKFASQKNLITFRDASCGPPTYHLNLRDCLIALHRALDLKFFDYDGFDLNEYEHYERVENGDFNWITPKFLAFCGPHQKTRTEGYPVHAPEEYFTYFKNHGISTIVRLNSPQYSSERFTAAGFEHRDLIFPDGTSPGEDILQEFLRIAEGAKGAVAVHCKAGLGRTGTLIAAYLMKHNRFSASEAIAWVRIVRPGSVIGQQQHYLESVKDMLWAEGRNGHVVNTALSPLNGPPSEDGKRQEVVEITSTTSSSTEYKDETGTTTVHEVVVVEKKVTSVDVETDSRSTSPVTTDDEADVATQGDALNLRKAMRDKEKQGPMQTRSKRRGLADDLTGQTKPVKRKRRKAKKMKTQ